MNPKLVAESPPPAAAGQGGRRAPIVLLMICLSLRSVSEFRQLVPEVQTAVNLFAVLCAIACGVFVALRSPSGERRGSGLVPFLAILALASAAWAATEVGWQPPIISGFLRFWAILAVALMARIAVQQSGPLRVAVVTVWTGLPIVLFVAIGAVFRTEVFYVAKNSRAVGTFIHPNAAGCYLVMYLLLCIWVVVAKRRILYIWPILISSIALIGSLSLGSLASFVVGSVVLVLVSTVRIDAKVLSVLFSIFTGLVLLTVPALASRLDDLNETSVMEASIGDQTNSFLWRLFNWDALITDWRERFFAVGAGLGRTDLDIQPLKAQPHNEYVRALVETGIVGALVLGIIATAVLVRATFTRPIARSQKVLAVAAYVAILVNAIAANTMAYAPAMYLFVMLWAIGTNGNQDLIPNQNTRGAGNQVGRTVGVQS